MMVDDFLIFFEDHRLTLGQTYHALPQITSGTSIRESAIAMLRAMIKKDIKKIQLFHISLKQYRLMLCTKITYRNIT